jgi:hypothetical protein
MRRLATLSALVLVALSAQAAENADCPADRTPLLILGTFHMDGSKEDLVNPAPADMSTPRRQAEIEALVQRLAEFRPTRVAIESSRISNYWNDRYAAWRKTRDGLGFNEIEQIGFRLADRTGLAALSPVDFPMWMDGTTAIERHEPPPQPASATPAAESPLMDSVRAQVAADDRVLEAGTVSEFLAYLNRPERAVQNHRWDVISNLAPGKGTSLYETTDHATNWYKRNLRIYTNVAAISGPGERVLLLIGAGHAHVLNGIAETDPRFCLVPATAFLTQSR